MNFLSHSLSCCCVLVLNCILQSCGISWWIVLRCWKSSSTYFLLFLEWVLFPDCTGMEEELGITEVELVNYIGQQCNRADSPTFSSSQVLFVRQDICFTFAS